MAHKHDKDAARKAWIAALRSGKYEQTDEQLLRNNPTYDIGDADDPNAVPTHKAGFCCLGVACDLFLKLEAPIGMRWDGDAFVWNEQELPARGDLPNIVANWLGLHSSEGAQSDGPTLAELNDNGKTFNEIADLLEAGDFWDENV